MAARRLLFALLLAGLVGPARAKELPPRPTSFVVDEAGWLDRSEEARLQARLLEYERDTSNQIVVAILRSLEGEDLADYSQRLAEHWRIGQADRDNGILLAVYAEDRLLSIEVGYGLEGAVTDLVAARIRDETLVPAFRAGRRAEGIEQAVEALVAASKGEYEGTGRARGDRERRDDDGIGFPFWLLFVLFFLLSGRRGRGRALEALILAQALSGGRGGRGGGFGGGGGGFRGGGGSFGGGGARGGW